METYDHDASGEEEGPRKIQGAPHWMVTYADLMSLLCALFVLILSFSVIDDNSFQRNAGPMREAFNHNADFKTDQQSFRSGGLGILDGVRTVPLNVPESDIIREKLIENLRETLARDLNNNLVELEETANGVVMRFPTNTAFGSGGAELSRDAMDTLRRLIPVLAKTPGEIKVGGHTDNVPIATLQYRSNWDLSAARATSVIHFLIRSAQIPKERLTSQGFADSRPLVPNDTPENRSRNRRVELSIEIPENATASEEFLDNMQPRQRIWTIEEGQREIQPGTAPVARTYERGVLDAEGNPSPPLENTQEDTDPVESIADDLNNRSREQFMQQMERLAR